MRSACRLMSVFGVDQAVIGDIVEQRRAGRSAIWLWQQTVVAVAVQLVSAVRTDPAVLGVVAVTVAVDVALPYVWTRFLMHNAVMAHLVWNPSAIHWWTSLSPHAFFEFVEFLHPWAWSGYAMWCVLFGVMAWCLVGIWPERATLIVATFILSNLCQTLQGLGGSFVDWFHDPINPVWASNLVWYAFFTLVAVPASIVVGGKASEHSCSPH